MTGAPCWWAAALGLLVGLLFGRAFEQGMEQHRRRVAALELRRAFQPDGGAADFIERLERSHEVNP